MSTSRGISGDALRSWIEDVGPNIKDLQARLDMRPRTYYDLYKKKIVPWLTVAKIHAVLRERHVYDINKFFPDFEQIAGHLVPDENESHSTRVIAALKRDNEMLQAKVIDLSEKLNAAYEKILDQYFAKFNESIDTNTAVLRKLLDNTDH